MSRRIRSLDDTSYRFKSCPDYTVRLVTEQYVQYDKKWFDNHMELMIGQGSIQIDHLLKAGNYSNPNGLFLTRKGTATTLVSWINQGVKQSGGRNAGRFPSPVIWLLIRFESGPDYKIINVMTQLMGYLLILLLVLTTDYIV